MKKELLWTSRLSLSAEESLVNELSFYAFKGECIELLGPTGSGKTALRTFFQGKEKISSGTLRFGERIYRTGESFQQTAGVMCIQEEPVLIGSLTVAENILLCTPRRKIRGLIRKRSLYTQVNFLLSRYAGDFRAETKVENLTYIQKRMVELLKAMENEVSLVYIDNAYIELGANDLRRIIDMIKLLKSRGITVICCGTGRPQLSPVTDRVAVMRQGRIVRIYHENDFVFSQFAGWISGGRVSEDEPRKKILPGKTVLSAENLSGNGELRGFSCCIKAGEVVGLYDMNYQANQEFIRILLGQMDIAGGRLVLNGTDYAPRSLMMAVQSGVAYLPLYYRQSSVIGDMSLTDNLMLPVMKKTQLAGGLLNIRVKEYIESRYARQIAGEAGSTKKDVWGADAAEQLEIIYRKWILSKPLLLICEADLNEVNADIFSIHRQYIDELAAGGTAVLLVSRNISELRQLSDRIIVINT